MSRRTVRQAIALTLCGAALACASPAFADVPISEGARVHFKAGVNLLQDPSGARYEDAYREFKAAYADSPSPRILGNMALCAMKLERDGEAIQAYEAYLAGVPDMSPDEKRQTTTDLGTLRAGAAQVALKLEPKEATVVDVRVPVQGGNVTNVYGPSQGTLALAVRPGHHALTIKADGYAPQTFEFEATPGAKVEHTFTLEKPREAAAPTQDTPKAVNTIKTRPVPTAVYVVGGATIALTAGAVVSGILALKKNSDFKAANTGADPTNAANIRSSGQALNVVNDILFGGAIVGAGVTTYLFVARPTVETPDASAPSAARKNSNALASLLLRTSPTAFSLEGAF